MLRTPEQRSEDIAILVFNVILTIVYSACVFWCIQSSNTTFAAISAFLMGAFTVSILWRIQDIKGWNK